MKKTKKGKVTNTRECLINTYYSLGYDTTRLFKSCRKITLMTYLIDHPIDIEPYLDALPYVEKYHHPNIAYKFLYQTMQMNINPLPFLKDMPKNYDYATLEKVSYYLAKNPEILQYISYKHSKNHIMYLSEGVKHQLDMSLISNPEFKIGQLHYIVKALKHGFDVSSYATPSNLVINISLALEGQLAGVDITLYQDSKYSVQKKRCVLDLLKKKIDLSKINLAEASLMELRALQNKKNRG